MLSYDFAFNNHGYLLVNKMVCYTTSTYDDSDVERLGWVSWMTTVFYQVTDCGVGGEKLTTCNISYLLLEILYKTVW